MKSQTVTGRHLDVPGGRIYYEVRGSGPLLLVVGQPMTSGPFAPLAELLAEDHTVVTYDPRGVGQSTVEDRSLDVTPELEADDLAAVIDAVGGGPADVFGSSGGAVAGLALVARHPDKVRTLIAHEPPVCDLLPDAAHIRAAVDDVEDAYRTHGPGAAFGKFVSIVMHQGPVTEDGVPPAAWPPPGTEQPEGQGAPPQRSAKEQADDELFLLRMLKPFTRYEPDVDVLRSAGPTVVVAVGDSSHGEISCRSAEALAQQLGSPPVRFPGDHGGFMADPAGFAAAIRQTCAR
jgi:pimeloyl-ACP methyl ester carboxylesterase